jgi:hypothetical protein
MFSVTKRVANWRFSKNRNVPLSVSIVIDLGRLRRDVMATTQLSATLDDERQRTKKQEEATCSDWGRPSMTGSASAEERHNPPRLVRRSDALIWTEASSYLLQDESAKGVATFAIITGRTTRDMSTSTNRTSRIHIYIDIGCEVALPAGAKPIWGRRHNRPYL